MRIQPWMKAVAGAAMLLGSQASTQAQPPAGYEQPSYEVPGGGGYYPAEGGYAMPPGPGGYYSAAPTYPGGTADPATLYPQLTPGEFQPWPEISPFQAPNIAQTQHFNRDGLWFKEMYYRQRHWNASVEALAVRFRDAGDATIGSPYANILNNADTWSWDGVNQNPNDGPYVPVPNFDPNIPGQYIVVPKVFPFPALSENEANYVTDASTANFPIRDASDITDLKTTAGIKLSLGYENEDYTGVSANFWWAFDQQGTRTWGQDNFNGIPVTQTLSLYLGATNISPRYGNIPLYNGEFIAPDFGAGSTAKYDVLYSLKFNTQAGGTNISFYEQPWYRNNGVMIRPLWGARYMYISEGFGFRGIDSGFNYDIDSTTFRPSTDTPTILYDQYEATLNNSINSNIAGPEVGFRIDLGRPQNSFNMWGETTISVAANNQNIHLSGDNIGDPLNDVRFGGYLVPRMLDPANESSFNETRNTTHVSPVFTQSVNADVRIFDVVPVLKDLEILEQAKLRIGYQITYVGVMARPADSINWQGFPLYPKIDVDYTSWWAQQINLGIDWAY